MGKIIAQCPSCDSLRLHVSKIECDDCSTTFEGKFEISPLLKLSEDDLHFIFDFVKCSGSLKDMALKNDVSYPTIRNKLNEVIKTIEDLEIKKENSKSEILKLVEEGKISAKDAAIMLKKL